MKMRHALWKLITYRPGLYGADILAWISIFMAELGAGYIAKLFFDWVTDSGPAGFTLWSIIALVVAGGVVRILTILAGALLDIRHRYTMGSLMHRNLLASILARPGAASLNRSTGEALNTMRDDAMVMEDTISWLIDQIGFTVYAGVALAILLAIDARVTAIVVAPLLIVIVAARLVAKHIQRFRRASREATERVTGAIGEAMEGVQTIQLARAEKHVLSHIRELNKERLHATVRDRLLSQSFHSFFWNAATLCKGLIMLAAAGSLRAGTFTVGDFALFVVYLDMVTEFFAHIGDYITMFKQSAVSLRRMFDLLQGAPARELTQPADIYLRGELPAVPQPVRGPGDALERLQVQGLSFRYSSAAESESAAGSFALHDVSFTVGQGEFVVITGRIGSGKSTLLKVLLGLLEPQAGAVHWNGAPVENPSTFFVPPRTAHAAQVPLLFSESLRDNVLLGLERSDEQILSAASLAVLEEDLAQMPEGLNTMLGVKGVRVSGGQRQRIAAARALVRDTELLVLDDLSSALDVETEAELWRRLFALEGRTFLVVSHRRPVLRRADRIVVLAQGRVEATGRLEELLDSSAEMRRIWGASG